MRDAAVLADPGGAGGDLLEAQHVQQRHLDVDRVPQLRVLGELDAHQQAAVGAALDAEPARAGDLARDQVLRHRGEVVVDALAMGLQAGLVPGRPELAAAADVGQHVDAAVLQPQLADRAE